MTSSWQPYREPIRTTILRNVLIALVVAAVISGFRAGFRGGLSRWLLIALLLLWPTFGGHWVEIWFLNWLRPRLPPAPAVQIPARLATWFAGGILLTMGAFLTAKEFPYYYRPHWPAWWQVGLAFIAVELVAHLFLQLFGRTSFYSRRG